MISLIKILLIAKVAFAATEIEKDLKKLNRLRLPVKVTVGPNDNYQFTVSEKTDLIVFSQKTNLSNQLIKMNLKTGKESLLLELGTDAKDPALSPNGRHIAFTQYKRKSLGSVCILNLKDNKQECVSDDQHQMGPAFWINDEEIGFVKKSLNSNLSEIFRLNIKNRKTQSLLKGQFWSPSYDAVSNSLFVVGKMKKNQPASIWQINLGNQLRSRLRLDMPGVSAFPRVSADGKTLYFNHYFSDTNHDQIIDAADNSVLFQLATADFRGPMIVPIQLTSSEMSCSQPQPTTDAIFTTCAFEGSVDIYSIPLYGQIPQNWSKEFLQKAHLSARSYQERVMILNNLKHRFRTPAIDIYYRAMLANHILAQDLTAAQFYSNRLEKVDRENRKFYSNLSVYLDAKKIQLGQSNIEVSARFRRQIKSKMNSLSGRSLHRRVIQAHLYSFMGQTEYAEKLIRSSVAIEKSDPITQYLYFQMALETKRLGVKVRLDKEFLRAINSKSFSMESRFFYAFEWLSQLQRKTPMVVPRRKIVESFSSKIKDEKIKKLFNVELEVLSLLSLSEEQRKKKISKLNLLIADIRKDYFLRKVAFTRSILNAVAEDAYMLTRIMASNWLQYTPKESTEFGYARDIFSFTVLDRAYDQYAKPDLASASANFYQSVALSDHMEAHFGYVTTMNRLNRQARMHKLYASLQKRNVIGENYSYVKALISPSKESLEILYAMKPAYPSAMRQLLIGAIELDIFIKNSKGYDWDNEHLLKIHKTLSLAADLGRDNKRILAAALINLGILHSRGQNFGFAVRYFKRREQIGFASSQQNRRFRWLFARALFFNNDSKSAADQMKMGRGGNTPSSWTEKEAFYRLYADQFDIALQLYEKIETKSLTIANQAKINLAKGFASYKLQRFDYAKKHLTLALNICLGLKPYQASMILFDPVRIKLITLGLLSQIEPKNTKYLEARIQNFMQIEERTEQIVVDKIDWYNKVIKSHLQLVSRYPSADRKADHIGAALNLALKSGVELAQYAAPFNRKAAFAGLIEGIQRPSFTDSETLLQLVAAIEKSHAKIKTRTPYIWYEITKLELLKRAYLAKTKNQKFVVGDLFSAENSKNSRRILPGKWARLKQIADHQ